MSLEAKKRPSLLKEMFNGPMVWAAVCTLLFLWGFNSIEEASHIKKNVWIEPENGSAKWLQLAQDFRRGEYLSGAFIMGLAVFIWYCAAKDLSAARKTED
jgi:hypothetical protein